MLKVAEMLSRSFYRLSFIRSIKISDIKLTRHLSSIPAQNVECKEIKTKKIDAIINFDEFMDPPKPRKKRKSSTEPRISKDIQSYFNNKEREFVLNQFPDKLLRKKVKTPENLYICDEGCAELIADYITKSDGNDKPIIEINPGLGLLSKHLLKRTKSDLMLYENNEFFNTELNQMIKKHPERKVILKNADFLGLWKTVHQDRQDNGNRLFDLLYGTPKKEWEDGKNI